MTHSAVHLDELERFPDMSGAPVLMPLRRTLGIQAFGVNCWTAPVGEPVIERHAEPNGEEELYVVLRGRALFTVEGETVDAGIGTAVYVPPDTVREARAEEPDTVVLAVGGKPGEAFEQKSWEDFQIAFAQARAGGDDEARVLVAETLERNPDAWQGWYNAAAFEALAGNAEGAFEHLGRAFELGPPEVRRLAAEGDDFTSLHSDPRWQELVA
jgi:mannose-6-phosphate isomerase-like protein (cupin superfamily)